MSWEVISSISEMIAAIGVIVSLVYLAVQVRDSVKATRVAAKLQISERLNNFQDMLIQSPELNQVMLEGRKGIENLNENDRLQFMNLCQKAAWFFSANHFIYKNNDIREEDFHEFDSVIHYWVTSRGFQQWWIEWGSENWFGGEIRDHVNQIIQKYPALERQNQSEEV